MPESSSLNLPDMQKFIAVVNLLNIILIIRIQCKKVISCSNYGSRSWTTNLAEFFSDPYNKSELKTITGIGILFFITANLNSYLNNVDPNLLNTFPHSTFFHFLRLAWPVAIVLILFFLHFKKQPYLVRISMQTVKEMIGFKFN